MARIAAAIVVLASGVVTAALPLRPVHGQQLENKHVPATSGTTRAPGRDRTGETAAGAPGPAYETRMPRQRPAEPGAGHGPSQAGGPDPTRELFQH